MGEDRETPNPALKTTINEPSEPSPERRIGAYRVLRELGHGGMGTVYLAARADDQYQKRVAIKVVRGLDSDQIVRHFRRERQILAALDHPNIARLLDGGTTEDGLPYFVMERVEGEPIDLFCDERKLSVQERLRLFQGVCAAVQYAHQNLVVHRDLKPKNILVDAQGVPKLLDFGIAKLLNPEISGEAATGTVLAMTPEYASPEQMRGQPITTATDVYSLGVVLYELLTGHRPYGRQARDSLELLRAVCEEEPERPSTAVGRTEQRTLPNGVVQTTTPETASRTREGSPEKLRRRLRGDLDNIVLMALRKEPRRRYRSVEALSEDIRRYLEGRPVTAHKATVWYRTGKFVRRNALGVGAAAAVFLFAVGFGVVTTVQSHRIARERDKAERLATFMMDLFKVSDPSEARGNSITAREVLDKGAEKISQELKDEPETRATLMATMGKVYQGLGLYGQAKPLLEEALRLRRQVLGNQHPDVVRSLNDLASVLQSRGEYAAAEPLAREALAMGRRHFGNEHPVVADSLEGLAWVLFRKGQYAAAEPLARDALAMQRKLLGATAPEVAGSLSVFAAVLAAEGKLGEAEALYRESVAILKKRFGSDHPNVAMKLNDLAVVLFKNGDYAGAETVLREVLAINRKILDKQHPRVANTLNNLAAVLQVAGKYSDAEALYREAISIHRKNLGDSHPNLGTSLGNLAGVLQEQGDFKAAEPLCREALAIRRKAFGNENPEVAKTLQLLAIVLTGATDYARAEPLFCEALAIRRKTLGNDHPDVAESLTGLSGLLVETSRAAEAERLAREAFRIQSKALPPDHPETPHSESALGYCLVKLGRFAEAEPLLLHGYEILSAKQPQRRGTSEARERVFALYEAWGKPDKAAQYRASAPKGS
jgi:eukaryotic-like serine/threonine-protein kinase